MAYQMGRDALKKNEKVSFYIDAYGGFVEIDKITFRTRLASTGWGRRPTRPEPEAAEPRQRRAARCQAPGIWRCRSQDLLFAIRQHPAFKLLLAKVEAPAVKPYRPADAAQIEKTRADWIYQSGQLDQHKRWLVMLTGNEETK
jgi:hypothetical protein